MDALPAAPSPAPALDRARVARARVAALVAAVPTWAWLGGIFVAAATTRLALSFLQELPTFVPDEYIYTSLARSLAHGTTSIRGGHVSFPALLQPLLTAPIWASAKVGTAYVVVKSLNAVAMSSSVVPLYLLARRIGLERREGLVCALFGAVSPSLFFVSFILADPYSFPLALWALFVALRVLERPTWRSQLAFLGLAGVAAFASIQFVALPAVLLCAAVVVERAHVGRLVRQYWPTLALLALGAAVALPNQSRVLGYYGNAPHAGATLTPASWLHWMSLNGYLVALCAGVTLVPGAIAGIVEAIVRSDDRRARAFGALYGSLIVILFSEAATSEHGSGGRFAERYLLVIPALAAPAFFLWARRGFRFRGIALLVGALLLATLSLYPLNTYATGAGKQDSPLLHAYGYLELHASSWHAAFLAAGTASLLLLLALVLLLRPTRTVALIAVASSLAWMLAVSATSTAFQATRVHALRQHQAADLSWIDRSGLHHVALVSTYKAAAYDTMSTLLWNPQALDAELLLGHGESSDVFRTTHIAIRRDGVLLEAGKPLSRPFVLSNRATIARFAASARAVRSRGDLALWRPQGAPRLRMLAEGIWTDGRQDAEAYVTVWPSGPERLVGTLRLTFSAPASLRGGEEIVLEGAHATRSLVLAPRSRRTIDVHVDTPGAYTVELSVRRGMVFDRGRFVGGFLAPPVFVAGR